MALMTHTSRAMRQMWSTCRMFSSSASSSSSAVAAAAFSAPAVLPDLPYDVGALEPAVSAAIMELHHGKHHRAYVTNLNAAVEKEMDLRAKGDTVGVISMQQAIKFNGGGHVNHAIFWTNLCPTKDFAPPSGNVASMIDARYGSLEAFKTEFNAKAAGVQGSGWGVRRKR